MLKRFRTVLSENSFRGDYRRSAWSQEVRVPRQGRQKAQILAIREIEVLTVLDPEKPEGGTVLDELANGDSFRRINVDAHYLESPGTTIIICQQELEHYIAVVGEIYMMSLNKVIAALR